MAYQFRLAICNEVFEGWDFAKMCQAIRQAGYHGVEIAPFTLCEDPAELSVERRKELRFIMREEGLEFVGLHWLMVSPKGLHVTTPDAALRARSWQHIRTLIDLCADLGGNRGVMVFGSPVQRRTTGSSSREEATRAWMDGLASVAPQAEERGVQVLIEALPQSQCDVVTRLAEAARWVEEIGSPAIQTMFDTHNAEDETEPHAALVERYFPLIRHVHVNEMDGRYPGAGDYDFKPILEVLQRNNYGGWVSAEVFDFKPGAETIARESFAHMKREIEAVGARA
jgi:D-psicose/D-tagatose/L-ribulose 3-epimerase